MSRFRLNHSYIAMARRPQTWLRAFGRKGAEALAAAPDQAPDDAAASRAAPPRDLPRLPQLPAAGRPTGADARLAPPPAAPTAPIANMWDSVGDQPQAAPAPADAVPPASGSAGTGRARTRLLDGDDDNSPAEWPPSVEGPPPQGRFPVGWLVVIEGPGRGSWFALDPGMSQIGRGAELAVSLDFGDMAISRGGHASVAYDAETGDFYVGHGGKQNIVRHNGMPVLTTERLASHDRIRIGETTLLFVALCNAAFTWDAAPSGQLGGAA